MLLDRSAFETRLTHRYKKGVGRRATILNLFRHVQAFPSSPSGISTLGHSSQLNFQTPHVPCRIHLIIYSLRVCVQQKHGASCDSSAHEGGKGPGATSSEGLTLPSMPSTNVAKQDTVSKDFHQPASGVERGKLRFSRAKPYA